MALYTNHLQVTEQGFELGKVYKVDSFEVFRVNGKFGEHWSAIVKSGDIVNYISQVGANTLAENLDEANAEVAKGALHFVLSQKHTKKYNKDFIACDFVEG